MARRSKTGLKVPVKASKEVCELVEKIRKKHYEDELDGAKLGIVMLPGKRKNKGKTVLGSASKIGRSIALYCEVDFIIGLPKDSWDMLTQAQREAVIDHELAHCGSKLDKDGRKAWTLLPHDVEEFAAVVNRHGLWRGDAEEVSHAQCASRALQKSIKFEAAGKQAAG